MQKLFALISKNIRAKTNALTHLFDAAGRESTDEKSSAPSPPNLYSGPDSRRAERRRPDTEYGHIRTERRRNYYEDDARRDPPVFN